MFDPQQFTQPRVHHSVPPAARRVAASRLLSLPLRPDSGAESLTREQGRWLTRCRSGRTFLARTFTHEQAVSAVVVSYYWHFVDVVWIALFGVIYLLQ